MKEFFKVIYASIVGCRPYSDSLKLSREVSELNLFRSTVKENYTIIVHINLSTIFEKNAF